MRRDLVNQRKQLVLVVALRCQCFCFLGGYTTDEATRAAQTLVPDILSYDPSRPASYPGNGRTLTDDAIDVFLSILTNGKVTTDNVGPHKDLLTSFPYLGQPHKARSAELVAA